MPGNSGSSFAESSLVAAGATPLSVATPGVRLGRLPNSTGTLVRLVTASNLPAGIDFIPVDNEAFQRGSIRYIFEPINADRMFFASDAAGIMDFLRMAASSRRACRRRRRPRALWW